MIDRPVHNSRQGFERELETVGLDVGRNEGKPLKRLNKIARAFRPK